MICLYMWIEWLSVVDIEFMCQKSYVWICCVLWKMINDEVVVWWFIEWIFMVDCCCWCLKKMFLMNWYVEYAIGELMMTVVVVVE